LKGQRVGYVRVSTVDQHTTRQLDGLELDQIFEDHVSGKSLNRPGWQECNKYLRQNDTLYVDSIDRLARNTEDLLRTVRELTGRGITIHFCKENLIFDDQNNPVQTLLLQMMSAIAQFERALILERQREGIALAKRSGRSLGRPKRLKPNEEQVIMTEVAKGTKKRALAARFGVALQTIYDIKNRWEKEKADAR
jgi:DNA invertase Pin-like site-specific DNA recombinase